jgi:hypothetical protein
MRGTAWVLAGLGWLAGAAVLPAQDASKVAHVPYKFSNVTTVAGGFITGFVAQPKVRGLYYVRTDIGGAYRWDDEAKRWQPLQDWLPFSERNLLGAESLAVDPDQPRTVYIAAGTYVNAGTPNGAILRSDDEGRHFVTVHVPFKMGGNEDGRFAGERLAVDPNQPRTLLMGTRLDGLWRSDNRGVSWQRIESFPWPPHDGEPANKDGLTFVTFDGASGVKGQATPVILVGADDAKHSLWRSDDAGRTWKTVEGGPKGMFPNHGVIGDGDLMFLSYGDKPGPNGMTDGAVWTYMPRTGAWKDVTPEKPGSRGEPFGYGMVTDGPSATGSAGQVVLASTMERWHEGDTIFRSTDGGAHWVSLKEGAQRDSGLAPWTRHTKGEAPFGHWLGAAMVDPYDAAHVLYGTGETIWESNDVKDSRTTQWVVGARGLEETADITLLSPLLPGDAGPHLFSGLGDIGCFRNDDLQRSPASGAMKNPELSNCDALAMAAKRPGEMVRVGRSWNPGPHGAVSHDGGLSWTPFATEPEGGAGGGDAAISADGTVVVWAVRDGPLAESGDAGAHWQVIPVKTSSHEGLQVEADATAAEKFWVLDAGAQGGSGTLYSVDSSTGKTQVMTTAAPGHSRLRIAANAPGVLWFAGTSGLFRASVPQGAASLEFAPVKAVAAAYAVGFGKAADAASAADSQAGTKRPPAIYMAGRLAEGLEPEEMDALGGGIFRSLDDGATWQRIDDPVHRYAWIEQITGDPRVFGRVYLGTNGRGVLMGDPQ